MFYIDVQKYLILFGAVFKAEKLIIIKEKERINWGIIAFIFVFCACLRLGMGLDLNKQTYPNNLNAYQEIMPLQRTVCVSDLLIPVFDMNDSINTIMFNDNLIIFDGDIR